MSAISFKIPKEDKDFLEWYSKKSATPIGTLYRSATQAEFHRWKLQLLVSLYSEGDIGFIKMCDIGNISLMKGMVLLEENGIEPPISDLVDDYTIAQTMKNIKDESSKNKEIFRNESDLARNQTR